MTFLIHKDLWPSISRRRQGTYSERSDDPRYTQVAVAECQIKSSWIIWFHAAIYCTISRLVWWSLDIEDWIKNILENLLRMDHDCNSEDPSEPCLSHFIRLCDVESFFKALGSVPVSHMHVLITGWAAKATRLARE